MKCLIEDCEREEKYTGLCGMHYKRKWRHGDPLVTETPGRDFERIECIAEDCDRVSEYSCGLCEKHYQRWSKYGRLHTINNPKGSYAITSFGHVLITVDGQRILEHRHLAEKALGKPLPKGAVVHHTGEPYENHGYCALVICPDQAYHMLIHKRMRDLGYANH